MKTTLISSILVLTMFFSLTIYAQDSTNYEKYIYVEFMPEFPDSTRSFFDYLFQNITYNGEEKEIEVGFTVDKDGSLSEFKAKGIDNEIFKNELFQVIKKSSPWIPGINNGRNVKVQVVYKIFIPDFINLNSKDYFALGDTYFQRNEFEKANKYYLIPLRQYGYYNLENLYFNIGLKYLEINELENACYYFNLTKKQFGLAKARKYYRKYCK